MRPLTALLRWTLVLALSACATSGESSPRSKRQRRGKHDAPGFIVLNGTRTRIVWTDGDSFSLKEGPFSGRGTRLQGYNTLEAYGPVHRWGSWTPEELYEVAQASSLVAATQEWACTTDGKEDGYRRLLISCPELAVEIIRQGYGMAYAPEGASVDPAALVAQREAMAAKRGMWRKGVVKGVVTSLHSADEEDLRAGESAYNRVVDTRTGRALVRPHAKTYGSCEEVCEATDGDSSCMIYVPFKYRYRDRPDCLRGRK